MVEVCDFDPVHKEFVIRYTLIQQKDLFLYKIMSEMHGHKIINQNSLHYLTFTVVGWIDVFSNDTYRKIIIDSPIYCQKEKGLKINAYVIMSNHLHLICYTKDPFQLSDIVRDFKKITSKSILESIQSNVSESRKEWMLRLFSFYAKYNKNNKTYQFWQQDSHPIELQSPKWINQKLAYIHLNPVRNGLVESAEDYLYSSAGSYLGKKGFIEIEKIEIENSIGFIDN